MPFVAPAFVPFLSFSGILMHDDPTPAGKMKWTPNASGQYDLQMQITGSSDGAYLRMSSFVLM